MAPLGTELLHLPPHLREVCAILATGLVRLRSRNAEDIAHDTKQAGVMGESSLHYTARQSGYAVPRDRPTA